MAPTTRRRCVATVRRKRQSSRQTSNRELMVSVDPKLGRSCLFCGRKEIDETLYGPLYQLGDVIVHYFCILLSSRAVQNGSDKEGIWGFLLKDIKTEIARGAREICTYCHKSGATISCCSAKCRKVFHLPCGIQNGSMHQFFQTFKSFCQQHRIIQIVDYEDLQKTESVQCSICKEKVSPTPVPSSLWAPCCKKDAWFHRKCIQELAISAGYFFKCPLCNNVEIFKSRMLTLGIYIPSRQDLNQHSYLIKYPYRDASWETVPHAYAELLHRHRTCDASTCLCPHTEKRQYLEDSGSWELILCFSCGSSGTHKLCSSLKFDQQWHCPSCQNIVGSDGPSGSKKRRLETDEKACDDVSTVEDDDQLSQNNNTRRGRKLRNRVTRESVRLNGSEESSSREIGVPVPERPRPRPRRLIPTINLLTDDEDSDDDVQLVSYIPGPNDMFPSSTTLPVITSYSSMSAMNNLSSSSSMINTHRSSYPYRSGRKIDTSNCTLMGGKYYSLYSLTLTVL